MLWGTRARPGGSRLLLTAGLLLGIIATSSVDFAVAGERRAQAHRLAAHKRLVQQQDAYLRSVRAVAAGVRHDVLPVQHILDTLGVPRAGDVYAARDALANDEARAALRADGRRLAALTPPTVWRAPHRTLRGALDGMTHAVATMRTRRKIRDDNLLRSYLLSTDNSALIRAELDWSHALRDLFRRRHQSTPSAAETGSARHPAVTLIGWTFGADRSCFAGMLRAAPFLQRLEQNSNDTEAMRQGADAMRQAGTRIRALAVPSHPGRLRPTVLGRLRSLTAYADAIRDVANGVDRLDLTAVQSAIDRLRTLEPTLNRLADGCRSVHATACATFIGVDRSKGRPRRSVAA